MYVSSVDTSPLASIVARFNAANLRLSLFSAKQTIIFLQKHALKNARRQICLVFFDNELNEPSPSGNYTIFVLNVASDGE